MAMRVPAKIYPLTIPAGGQFSLLAVGSYFKILTASGSFEVTGDAFGQLGSIQAGQGLRLQNPDTTAAMFTRLTFRDTSGAANNLTVLVAGDGFIDDRVTGEVSVVDGGKTRTLAQQTFMTSISCAAAAAQISHVGLFNPAGSGKNVIVKAYRMTTAPAAFVRVGVIAGNLMTTPLGQGRSKLSRGGAGALSTALARSLQAAALAGDDWDYLGASSTASTIVTLQEPIVLEPNFSMYIAPTAINIGITAAVEWTEELVA